MLLLGLSRWRTLACLCLISPHRTSIGKACAPSATLLNGRTTRRGCALSGVSEGASRHRRAIGPCARRLNCGKQRAPSTRRDQAFIDRDRERRVLGFGGLATMPMHHRFEVDGRELSTWCAWDSLFIPEILGRSARVASLDPENGETRMIFLGLLRSSPLENVCWASSYLAERLFCRRRASSSFYTWGNSGLEPYSGSGNQLSTNTGPTALQSWRAAMEHYVGLDISLKLTAILLPVPRCTLLRTMSDRWSPGFLMGMSLTPHPELISSEDFATLPLL